MRNAGRSSVPGVVLSGAAVFTAGPAAGAVSSASAIASPGRAAVAVAVAAVMTMRSVALIAASLGRAWGLARSADLDEGVHAGFDVHPGLLHQLQADALGDGDDQIDLRSEADLREALVLPNRRILLGYKGRDTVHVVVGNL